MVANSDRLTKASTNKKRKVTFELPESDCESDSKEKSNNRNSYSQNRKQSLRPRFEPPPPDSDLKVRPILKKTDTPTYEEPYLTSSFLPLYIINSVINSQLGSSIPDSFEDSESENNSDDSDSLSNNLFIKHKNKLDLQPKNSSQSPEQNSFDDNIEECVDFWLVNSENKYSEDSNSVLSLKEEKEQENLNYTNSLNNCIAEISNNCSSKSTDAVFDQNSDTSPDVSESTDTDNSQVQEVSRDKPKVKKPRRKLRVSVNIQENGCDTGSGEIFELELFGSHKSNLDNNDRQETTLKSTLKFLNASEISYLDHYCNENFDTNSSLPKKTVATSSSRLFNAVVCSPPVVVVQNLIETALRPVLQFLNASEVSYLGHYCNENFDTNSPLPKKLAKTSSIEFFNAVVCLPPAVVQNLVETTSKPILQFLNASEVSYLGHYCDEEFNTNSPLPKKLAKTSSTEFFNAVVCLPPAVVQNPVETTPKPVLHFLNASEVSYLDHYCNENYYSNSFLPKKLAKTTTTEFFVAVVYSPPAVVQNPVEDVEKHTESKRSSKATRKVSVQLSDITDTEDKENLNHSLPSSLLNTKSEVQTNGDSVLHPLPLEPNTLPLSSTTFHLNTTPEPPSPTTTTPTELQQQTSSHHKPSSNSHHQSSINKHIFTAVKLPSESETNPAPIKRTLRPYQKKPRQPFKLIMDYALDLNCAGEPENLSPHKRDDIKEKGLLIWIYNMIDEPARVDYEFFLKDGCILCKLMNRIKPGCIPEEEITWEGVRSKQKNIANFLSQAEKYGVPKAKLFYPEDLLQLRHIPRVTRCIYGLAKIAQEDPDLGPNCPHLGDEPNFVQPAKKVEIPGHRDTKEVMSQITATMQKKEEKKLTRMHSLYK